MSGSLGWVARVAGVGSTFLFVAGVFAGPSTAPTSRPGAPEDYSVIAAGHIGRLRARMGEIDDELGASSREEHDRLLVEKMAVLFELLTLEGRGLEPLDNLAMEARSHEPGESLATAADYWRLRVALSQSDRRTGSQPAAGVALKLVEQYLDSHPRSPYAAVLIEEVIDAAYGSRDFDSVDRLLGRLKRDFADHPTTKALVGGDRLRRAIGEVWSPNITDTSGIGVDWAAMRGKPVVVVFWASWDVASQRALRQIASWPGFGGSDRAAMVAISLDRQPAEAATFLEKVGVRATVCCDGRGWQSELATAWGIRSLPVVLILDEGGRLRAVVSGVGSDFDKRLRQAWRSVGGRLE